MDFSPYLFALKVCGAGLDTDDVHRGGYSIAAPVSLGGVSRPAAMQYPGQCLGGELLGWFWGPKCVPGRVGLGTRDLSVDMPVPTMMTDPGLREAEKISYSNFSHRGVRRWPECKSQKIVKDAFRCAHGRVERQRKKKEKRKKKYKYKHNPCCQKEEAEIKRHV